MVWLVDLDHHPTGVQVVFDPVGGAALRMALRCVSWGAHYLVIGALHFQIELLLIAI
jgi:NADPH:quinone reductase-like Zn-dependent oxidoreductase